MHIRIRLAPQDGGSTEKPHTIILPHETVAGIYTASETYFHEAFVGADGSCKEYWDHVGCQQWAKSHPGWEVPNATPEFAIPMGVHADKGQHIKRDKILTISYGSTVTRAPTRKSKYLYTILPDELSIKLVSEEILYSIL
eukprot:9153911-Karenia_brevis.AAC.1